MDDTVLCAVRPECYEETSDDQHRVESFSEYSEEELHFLPEFPCTVFFEEMSSVQELLFLPKNVEYGYNIQVYRNRFVRLICKLEIRVRK
jgi:hypothetical protein